MNRVSESGISPAIKNQEGLIDSNRPRAFASATSSLLKRSESSRA
jgi:hypothetical protein